MGKTRAEIQRKYREKKKVTDPEFLKKERLRVRGYYVPAETLSKKKLAERNRKAMLRNRLSRFKKKQQLAAQNEDENQNISDSGYASLEPVPSTSSSTPDRIPLVVKLPSMQSSAKSKGLKKVRARALARQRKLITALSKEVEDLQRRIKIKNTKINRLERKVKSIKLSSEKLTPRKQTESEILNLDLTPNRRRSVRKKLLLSNTLLTNIEMAKRNITTKKRDILHQIIGGKIVTKNRLATAINKITGIDRKRLSKVHGTFSFFHHEFRNSITKRVETKVVQFLEREDNSRVQPGKADMKKSESGEKKQTLVLTDYLKNLHLKFQSENPDIHISLASFCRMRPKHILLASFISRNACQCIRPSPSSQYRNKYIFHTVANHIALYGMPAVWNYFEAGHGKGPCDGLGGTTKRMADEAIRQGNTVIQDAQDFFKWGKNSSMTGVTFLFVEKTACDRKRQELYDDKSIKPVKNTMKLHAIAGSTRVLEFHTRETSCYCDSCLNGSYCNTWSLVTVNLQPKQRLLLK